MKVLVLHIWRESELKSKKKMCYWEGILQFLLCQCCRQRNKSLHTMNRALFQVSITDTCKSTVINVPKILIQSATISDYLWGIQGILSIYLFYFWELLTLRDSHHYLHLTAVLVYMHETKKTFCSTFFFVVVVLLPVMETTSEINSYFGHCMLSIKLQSVEILSLVIFKTLIYVS